MGMFGAIDSASSGASLARVWLDAISDNVANINTVRPAGEEPFRARMVVARSVEGSGGVEGMTNPKVVWRTREASPSGLAYWQGDLWMAGLRGERLWQIPVEGTDTGEPMAHFEGDYGRLRTVVVSRDSRSLLLTSSNTDGRGEVRDSDDRLLQIRR